MDDLIELERDIERLWQDGEISFGLRRILVEMLALIKSRATLSDNGGV